MAVKKTGALKVAASQHLPAGHVGLHPNDGFDLGLMTKAHPVQWCVGIGAEDFLRGGTGQPLAARIELLNQCPHNTIQLNMQQWRAIGSPEQVVLLLDGVRMYLHVLKPAAAQAAGR